MKAHELLKKGAKQKGNKLYFSTGLIFKKHWAVYLRCPTCGRRLDNSLKCFKHGKQGLRTSLLSTPIRLK